MNNEEYSLTSPQNSIWLTEQYYKGTNINNVCGTFFTKEKIDFDILQKSINIFIQNNDSFKIKLLEKNGEVKQYFSEVPFINFEIVKVENALEQKELEEKIAAEVFDLIDKLLFKFVLFKYPEGNGGFVINTHHLISDSWTAGLVANNVSKIYYCLLNNKEIEKNEELSYKQYISDYQKYIESNKFNKDKEYWENEFGTVPEIATIPSIKNNKIESTKANRLLIEIQEEKLKSIKEICEQFRISLYNFFMAVFSIYIGRVSNLDEFVIGTPILNRTNYKEKHTAGMFINTLPFKIDLNQELNFKEFVSNIASRSMALLRHQKYSYQFIIENLRKKETSIPGLYNILLSYQITKMNENLDMLQHETTWTFNKNITDDMDIHIYEWNENNTLKIAYDYKINKYDEEDIKDIHNRILHIIDQVIEKNEIILKDIEIVTPEEKHKILYEFNDTKVDYPKDKTIAQVFEKQVEFKPNKPAIMFENQTITYQALNQKANQLARYLRKQGVETQDRVVILADKSIELYISIMAILKLGALYVPIDSEYPQERIDKIIQDCKPKIVVVDEKYKKLVKNEKHCIIPLINLEEYSNKNLENTITSRTRGLHHIHFWFYWKSKRSNCPSSWCNKISNEYKLYKISRR